MSSPFDAGVRTLSHNVARYLIAHGVRVWCRIRRASLFTSKSRGLVICAVSSLDCAEKLGEGGVAVARGTRRKRTRGHSEHGCAVRGRQVR